MLELWELIACIVLMMCSSAITGFGKRVISWSESFLRMRSTQCDSLDCRLAIESVTSTTPGKELDLGTFQHLLGKWVMVESTDHLSAPSNTLV